MKLDDGIDKEELKGLTTPVINYAHFGALAFQMAAIIALAVWGGRWLDRVFGWKFPLFTILLVVVALAGVIWSVYRSLKKDA